MNKSKHLIIGFMAVICLLANILNQDMQFTIISIIGYVIMLSLSFVKYEWIEKYYIWIIDVFIAILVIINITPLGYTVNGMKCLKIVKYFISNSVLLLMFLPLAAIFMNTIKVRKPFWILLGITAVVHIFHRPKTLWETFVSKEGNAAYIYEQIERFSKESKFIGSSDLLEDMPKYLPEHKNGTILTAYGVEYGIAIKLIVCVLVVALLGLIIYQMVKKNVNGDIFAIGCVTSIGLEVVIIILQNMLLIPYKALVTFLPFFSKGLGSLIMCYILMGLILSVFNVKDDVYKKKTM